MKESNDNSYPSYLKSLSLVCWLIPRSWLLSSCGTGAGVISPAQPLSAAPSSALEVPSWVPLLLPWLEIKPDSGTGPGGKGRAADLKGFSYISDFYVFSNNKGEQNDLFYIPSYT